MSEFIGLPHLDHDELDMNLASKVFKRSYRTLVSGLGSIAYNLATEEIARDVYMVDVEDLELALLITQEPKASSTLRFEPTDLVRFIVNDGRSKTLGAAVPVPYFCIARYPERDHKDMRHAWMIHNDQDVYHTEITGVAIEDQLDKEAVPLMREELEALDVLTRAIFSRS